MDGTAIVVLALDGLGVLGVVGAGAPTALPGAAPDGPPADDRTGNASGDATDRTTADGDAGPPAERPGPVSDFVGDLHRTIGGFAEGSLDRLGSAVGEVVPGGASLPNDTPAGP